MSDIPHVVFGAFDYRAGATPVVIRRASPEAADVISGKLFPMCTPR